MARPVVHYPLHVRQGLRKVRDKCDLRELARYLGISPQAISQWRVIPPSRVIDIEAFADIPREVLRPDLYRSGR